jgi:hypothetical protein
VPKILSWRQAINSICKHEEKIETRKSPKAFTTLIASQSRLNSSHPRVQFTCTCILFMHLLPPSTSFISCPLCLTLISLTNSFPFSFLCSFTRVAGKSCLYLKIRLLLGRMENLQQVKRKRKMFPTLPTMMLLQLTIICLLVSNNSVFFFFFFG